ncbi:hypothetical protein D3C78_1736650 [compost metagenome]
MRVGGTGQAAQVVGGNVGGKERQHFERQVRVRQAAPGLEHLLGHLRQLLRHGQAAVGRQAFQQDVGKRLSGHAATGRDVFHVRFSTRKRVTLDRTNGIASIRSMA